MKAAEVKAEYEAQILELKKTHVDEITKIMSNAEAAKRIEAMAVQVQANSNQVEEIQKEMYTKSEHQFKEREQALKIKEDHLMKLQGDLLLTQKELDLERNKIQALIELKERKNEHSKTALEEEYHKLIEEKNL